MIPDKNINKAFHYAVYFLQDEILDIIHSLSHNHLTDKEEKRLIAKLDKFKEELATLESYGIHNQYNMKG